eukprot:13903823-Alexandrium_andersonii.AAC.1
MEHRHRPVVNGRMRVVGLPILVSEVAVLARALERNRSGWATGASDRPVAAKDSASSCSLGRLVGPTAGSCALGASVSAGPGVRVGRRTP